MFFEFNPATAPSHRYGAETEEGDYLVRAQPWSHARPKCRCKSIQSDGGPMQGLKGKCAKSAIARDLHFGVAKNVRSADAVQSKKIEVWGVPAT